MTEAPKQYRYNHRYNKKPSGCDTYNILMIDIDGGFPALIDQKAFERDYEPVEFSTEPSKINDLQHVTDKNVVEIEQAAQGWRPIDENTPKGTYILLYAEFGFWSGSETITVGTYENWHITATYWMPLPKPPAREGDK